VTVSRHTALQGILPRNRERLISGSSSPFGLAAFESSPVGPFAPVPLQHLHHYYDPIRHHWTRPFSRPRGSSTCAFRFASPSGFSCSMTKPPTCSCRLYAGPGESNHASGGQSLACPRGLTAPRVFRAQPSFDTSSTVHLRSAPSRAPGTFSVPFPSPFNTKIVRFQHRRAV
jgi:hypothetical protein